MGRWEPNARGRLEQAAYELYAERGYEQTTVAQIAERAGLTERTFFRHFADKREVVFGGAGEVEGRLTAAVAAAPDDAAPLEAVAAALAGIAELIDVERGKELARRRSLIVSSNVELQERELIKLAGWTARLAEALRERGADAAAARLAAEVGLAVFRTAFERWVDADGGPTLTEVLRLTFAELGTLALAHA